MNTMTALKAVQQQSNNSVCPEGVLSSQRSSANSTMIRRTTGELASFNELAAVATGNVLTATDDASLSPFPFNPYPLPNLLAVIKRAKY